MPDSNIRRALVADSIARWVIIAGGVFIIISVIAILFLILHVTWPLFQSTKAQPVQEFKASGSQPAVLALGVDEYLETAFILDNTGSIRIIDLETEQMIDQHRLYSARQDSHATITGIDSYDNYIYNVQWSDSTFTMEAVKTVVSFEGSVRQINYEFQQLAAFPADTLLGIPRQTVARQSPEGGITKVSLLADNRFHVTQELAETNLFGITTTTTSTYFIEDELPGDIATFTLDHSGQTLYAGTTNGYLLRWDLREPDVPVLLDEIQAFNDGRTTTALALMLGDISLVVGDETGEVSIWFPVRSPAHNNQRKLHRIHTLTAHDSPVIQLLPSQRHKSVLSLSQQGDIHFDHMTSGRHILTLENDPPVQLATLSLRSNGLLTYTAKGQAVLWKLENPHPEASLKAFFGKVWYESYDQPEYIWQSSSGSTDFEPKFSLVPLMFGTIKGTFYAMLFAVPLALLGAIYTSQFMYPSWRKLVKPSVEIMAAIPSVVIGFLAALWFAPIVEGAVIPIFLSFIIIPLMALVAVLLWQSIASQPSFKQIEKGYEFILIVPFILVGVYLCSWLGPLLEEMFFAGDFKQWLFEELNTRYDQRNNIIIAFGLGFAVIPIIFTIADDALSNVPRSLSAASLALGASRWQTVWKVVLPSASPGIFAGVMIGFGRAIGETMIVLMATGNTPIIDWSIFNGMRTLSANIAVEIPEAPFNGTLYRVLFLSAVILFVSTFIINTAAELVRQRLRKKYGRFQ
ncbi:MAG: ABC transporter permease subunit [Gemmatimonadetes bacterium]|nr:MAG: ABC transporter permease subunit [Gemmatimonadota bacterium]